VCVCHLSALSHTHTHDRVTTLVLVRSCSGASVRSCSCYCSCFQSISIPRAHDPSPMGPSRELRMILRHCNTLQHTATHCNTLQHTATHYNTQQHTAAHGVTPQHATPCYTTLHDAALHCNTLMNTATHCNTMHNTPTTYVSLTLSLSLLCIHKNTHTQARELRKLFKTMEKAKTEGNEFFKIGKCPEAIEAYTTALGIDPLNTTFNSVRCVYVYVYTFLYT